MDYTLDDLREVQREYADVVGVLECALSEYARKGLVDDEISKEEYVYEQCVMDVLEDEK